MRVLDGVRRGRRSTERSSGLEWSLEPEAACPSAPLPVQVSRDHHENDDNDPLYVDYDGDVRGRAQITASVYDTFGRLTDRMEYGTNGGADFDRDPTGGYSVPARSDTILRTTWTYNIDGTTKTVEDPRGLKTFWVYDAMGRQVREVKNWNGDEDPGDYEPTGDSSGIAGSVTNASNVTVRYEYSKGLRTKLIADLPSGETDQETVYTYGTTKGAAAGDSKIATGHLLQKTTYPDSSSAGDVVTYAYNAQSQELWKQDQAGNVYETEFDAAGRVAHKRVTTLASGFDGAVRRITTAYDSLGRTLTVTQYDNATVGSGTITDEVKYTYDGWGNIEKFEQDRNSAVGASGSVDDYETSYTFAKQTTGRNTIRLATMTLPSGKVITYVCASRSGLFDNASSRVTDVKDGAVVLATWDYNGVGQVVGTGYPEPEMYSRLYDGSSPPVYDGLDSFGRVVKSRWTKDLVSPVNFYGVDLTYDRDSNITSADDSVHAGFDVKYTMDDVNRLVRAEEGTLSSGSITSRTRDQQWTMSGTGNWKRDKVDLNGDADFVDTDEVNDTRSHNDVNELTARDTDSNSSNNYTLAFDAAGNQTDDGKDYKYEYDAFYRLRKVKQTGNSALVAEYRYNGLGFKIAEHADTDTDGDVDSNDKWYFDAFDERWRQVSRFRESDTSPKEEFVAHQAGASGRGGSSYIDLVICRYKDANTAWTSASDGTLEERLYYCQNQHADVVAIVGSDGTQREGDRYSAYGVPFGLPGGDCDSDGDCDSADVTQVQAWIDAPAYDVRGDVDLDGDVDSADKSAAVSTYQGASLAWRILGSATISSNRGYAGELRLANNVSAWTVRNRVFFDELGRWNARDDAQYKDGVNLYQYNQGRPTTTVDPSGRTLSVVVLDDNSSKECPNPRIDQSVEIRTDKTCKAPFPNLVFHQVIYWEGSVGQCSQGGNCMYGALEADAIDEFFVVQTQNTSPSGGKTPDHNRFVAMSPCGWISYQFQVDSYCVDDETKDKIVGLGKEGARHYKVLGQWGEYNSTSRRRGTMDDNAFPYGWRSEDTNTAERHRSMWWNCCTSPGDVGLDYCDAKVGCPGRKFDMPFIEQSDTASARLGRRDVH
ncbi:MAG: hypothetical protein HZA53_05890 [Planctomycetes bacterium]|nr:hypothetical protein [Planctomycetota bacterium]